MRVREKPKGCLRRNLRPEKSGPGRIRGRAEERLGSYLPCCWSIRWDFLGCGFGGLGLLRLAALLRWRWNERGLCFGKEIELAFAGDGGVGCENKAKCRACGEERPQLSGAEHRRSIGDDAIYRFCVERMERRTSGDLRG
jgi:hypothetical protein